MEKRPAKAGKRERVEESERRREETRSSKEKEGGGRLRSTPF